MVPAVLPLLLLAFVGCGDDIRGNITIVTPTQWEPALGELAKLTNYTGLSVNADPGNGYQIVVVDDESIPTEGYQLAVEGSTIRVAAHDLLGAQFGVSAALEGMGFRFRHPLEPYVPFEPTIGDVDSDVHQPDIRVRGLQLHTLHPIEGYFAFWEPGAGSTNEAHRIIDWVVKNRGNFLQWVPLDNIMQPEAHAAWKPFTQELLAYAHARGIRVGINVQLFGQSNLQNAFDLSDDKTGDIPIADEIRARLPLITGDLPFDVYTISFGEFFNADPDRFIASLNEARAQLRATAPDAEMHALIHVGDEQRIMYMGEELIYYFLVKFADPSIIPDVHTVMFYNLFEDAGGAYHHNNFGDHRTFLQQKMCAGERVAYQPETGYWVAFDNSVPQYYPLYVHSRLHDLTELQKPEGACGTLDQHYLFSTGWEWGYWLNDYAGLRASYELMTTEQAIEDAFGTDLGPQAADLVTQLTALQRTYLLEKRLTGYLVGRDSVIDLGRELDIVSQPDRITFDQLIAGEGREEVETMLANMREYAAALDDLEAQITRLSLPDTRWGRELEDGFVIDALRAHFVIATWEATLAHIDGDTAAAMTAIRAAEELAVRGQSIVTSRHADLHDKNSNRYLERTQNSTFYQFGYLYFAHNLCYWNRELLQVEAILGNSTMAPLSCFF
ncbi:MAG: hypothetical protein SFX73_05190 [Kofleriaceae bacterium]|nr:hypothetical protein [Kofleriaceae bacterium]